MPAWSIEGKSTGNILKDRSMAGSVILIPVLQKYHVRDGTKLQGLEQTSASALTCFLENLPNKEKEFLLAITSALASYNMSDSDI